MRLRAYYPTMVCLLASLSLSCVNRVIPPAHPTDPTTVYLLDHGRHPSLVIPRENERWVRYSYGNWAWYAESRANVFTAFSALFWPNKAGLGRQRFSPADTMFHPAGPIGVPIVNVYPMRVSSEKARRLESALDDIFTDGRDRSIYNPDWELEFVPHPRRYWIFHQSNKVMAQWLDALGCDVRGPVLFSKWEILEPSDASP